ncbi:MAG TPA: hypothetical protein VLS88_08985 [Polyangiales bacterium]|nr:hypothetical protein [Polyangiales bacterium]
MSLPRTLVIDEHGEEPTIVDQRFHEHRRAVETGFAAAAEVVESNSRHRRSGLRGIRWWHAAGAFLFAVMLLVPSVFAYREHSKARALRAVVDEITSAHDSPRTAQSASPGALSAFTWDGRTSESAATSTQSASRTVDRIAMERRGADLLVANDYPAALEHYRALAASFPEDRAFADAVIVLESKQKCLGQSSRALGAPCR